MKAFRLVRPRTCEEAAKTLSESSGARLKAGGVDLLDRMKERVDNRARSSACSTPKASTMSVSRTTALS